MPMSQETIRDVVPLRPNEILEAKKEYIPGEVIRAFNDLIVEKYRNGIALIDQKDIIDQLLTNGYTAKMIFERHLLDIEEIYQEAGWEVTGKDVGGEDSYRYQYTFKGNRPV